MRGIEALSLYGGVSVEGHVHAISAGDDGVGHLTPAIAAQAAGVTVIPVKHLNVVIHTLLVRLQLKVIESLKWTNEV